MTKRVYYLDDEVDLCNLFKEFIQSDTVEVVTFVDTQEAIQRCEKFPPDLMFIDYRLSDTTGNLVAEALSDDFEKILVTGELELPQHAVFSEVISKPYRLLDIQKVVDERLK